MSERLLPLILSIVVLIAVAIINQYSKTFAAIATTMPTKIPLALWIVYVAEQGNPEKISEFSIGLIVGIIPTVMFIVGVWFAAKAGWTFVPILLAGTGVWLVTLLITTTVRQML